MKQFSRSLSQKLKRKGRHEKCLDGVSYGYDNKASKYIGKDYPREDCRNISTMNFACEEKGESSALIGAYPNEGVWIQDRDSALWYSPHVNRILLERTGHCCSPRFKSKQGADGIFVYESLVDIGRGAWRSTMSSGDQSSTLNAMNSILAIISRIPIDRKINWHEELFVLLPYAGMQSPVFKTDSSIGMPTIRCTLTWGNDAEIRSVVSDTFYGREQSFNDAVQRAMGVGPVDPIKSPPKEPNWVQIVKQRIPALSGYGNLIVSFHVNSASGSYRCRVKWGKNHSASIESRPMTDKAKAFDDAINCVRKSLKSKQPRPTVKSPTDENNPNEEISNLLAIAKQRWSVERNYLFQRKLPTHNEIVRLNVLSSFLVILDPLRCYELDRPRRIEAIQQLQNELSNISTSLTGAGKHSQRINALRLLVGGAFKESSDPILITLKIEDALRREGYEPSKTIDDLLDVRYIRKSTDSEYTLSPIGSNALESALTTGVKAGSIGGALPLPITVFLLDLKTKLQTER